jgi:phage/plasmid-like protein (TIGR03299 family)
MQRTMTKARELPWSGSAKAIMSLDDLEAAPSTRQAMKTAGLDWNVALTNLYADSVLPGRPRTIEVPGFGVQRDSDSKVLGVVGNRYEPIQNRRIAEFTDLLVDTGKSSLAGMGEGFGGSKVYTVVKMDGELEIPGMPDEGMGGFLVVHNSHDGSTAMTASILAVRWACSNGLIALVPGLSHTVKIRHSGDIEAKFIEANRLMAHATGYLNELELLVPEMLSHSVSKSEGERLLDELIPIPEETDTNARAVRNAERRQSEVRDNWLHSENLEDIRFTAWGFHNAVVETDQWVTANRRRRTRTPMERLMQSQQAPMVGRSLQLLGVG